MEELAEGVALPVHPGAVVPAILMLAGILDVAQMAVVEMDDPNLQRKFVFADKCIRLQHSASELAAADIRERSPVQEEQACLSKFISYPKP
ncbi:hypothetical protein F4824DRAFT_496124 [Ustulina deusta]|nr:hypothetical protein F4824DRAFT_496124 [Ustulina deusta]